MSIKMAKSLQLFQWLIFCGVSTDYFLGSEADSGERVKVLKLVEWF